MSFHPVIYDEIARQQASSVEHLQEELRTLLARRQALRDRDANREELESNRVELARRQRQLSQALIDLHLRHAETEAA